jgi:putative spermidine/putrescine transport system permease protein
VTSAAGTAGAIRAGRRRLGAGWLVAPAVLLVAFLFLYPAGELLTRSFTESPGGTSHYESFFESQSLVTILVRSAWTAFVVTVISLLVGYPVAYIAATSSQKVRILILGTVAASLFVSVVVRGYSWLAILDRNGLLNTTLRTIGLEDYERTLVRNFAGVVIGMIQYGIPFMILPIYDSMRRFDERLRYAAATLGARPSVAFLRVYLPLTLPGVGAGCTIVFIATLGYYVLPSILGGPQNIMVGELIAEKFHTTLEWGLGAAIASVLLAVALLFFFAFYRLTLRPVEARGRG